MIGWVGLQAASLEVVRSSPGAVSFPARDLMRAAVLLFLPGLLACSDYDLNPNEDPQRPGRDTSPPREEHSTPEDTGEPADTDTDPVDTEPVNETEPVADAGADQLVAPLDTVWLNGRASYDPGGNEPLTYKWTLLSKPSGSTADITWVSTWETPFFFADLAGDYKFKLEVTNTLGISDSTPDTVLVTAEPSDGFYVQVSWDTSDTDIDLHLLRTSSSQIFDSPDDNCFCNTNPSWYAAGRGDDPSLDWDDIDGFGPETATIDTPATGDYRILLNFYGENGNTSCDGPCKSTKITVKVYVAGSLIDTMTGTLDDAGEVWEAGTFSWPAATVTHTDRYSTTSRTECY